MGNSKKRRSGATPEEMLLLISKAEEKLAKNTKEETKTENNKTGHRNVSNRNEGKDISSTAVQKKTKDKTKTNDKTKTKTNDKTKTKTNDKTKEKAYAKPIKKVKDKSSKNIKRGATPEEMLQLIAKAEERIAKEDREKASIENIISAKTEEGFTTERKKRHSFDTPPAGTKKFFMRISWYLLRPKHIKTKVAIFMVLATLSATALTFGLSVVNSPSGIVRDALTITKQAQIVTIDFTANETDMYQNTLKVHPAQPQKVTLTVLNGYNQRNRDISSTEGNINLVESSDNNWWEISFDSYTYFYFSDISIPTDALIKSVVVFVEHFEEKQFVQGKLEWSIGTGWPRSPVVWASIKAPVQKGKFDEAVDSWDITSLVNTCEKINSLQLQVKNNNNVADSKTLIDYTYVVVRWD
jgi:hypothetical protein